MPTYDPTEHEDRERPLLYAWETECERRLLRHPGALMTGLYLWARLCSWSPEKAFKFAEKDMSWTDEEPS